MLDSDMDQQRSTWRWMDIQP